MRRALVLCACIALGCAGETGAARPSAVSSPETTGPTRQDVDTPVVLAPAAAPTRALLAIHAIDPTDAEDGLGGTVPASAPVAIDLDAHAFPPRAFDPVLTIGRLRFVHYTHPHPGVLRFVIASADLLERGATVRVQYAVDGSDARDVVTLGDAELVAARQP